MQRDWFGEVASEFQAQRRELWERLPALLDRYEALWRLQFQPPFANLSYNFVLPAIREDGSEVVLKIGMPHKELLTEIAALQIFDGMGSVRLLEAEPERGALLLERLHPGTPLTSLADEINDTQATSIAATVMRGLWRPAPPEHAFPHVRDWARGMERLRAHFGGGTGPFPARLLEEAESLFAELLASSAEPVVLHGDLHHDNILSSGHTSWLAIDPKGIVGEPAYEVGALLRNLWPDRHTILNPGRLLERRVSQLCEELGIDRARIRGWAVAQAVLSAWWCAEDGEECCEPAIALAELLATIP